MEETKIKFKPSIKIELSIIFISLIIGIITLVFFFQDGLRFYFIIPFIGNALIMIIFLLFTKIITTYSLSENQIESESNFFSKYNEIYRLDQLTSITLKQNFIMKLFNLGTIEFGVFGKNTIPDNNQRYKNEVFNFSFKTISNYSEIFKILSSKLDIETENIVYKEKPILMPGIIKILMSMFSLLITIFIPFILLKEHYKLLLSWINVEIIIIGFLIIFLFITIIKLIFYLLKTKNTIYKITEKSLEIKVNYIFSKLITIIPLSKITNVNIDLNRIIFNLFRCGNIKIYTGGNKDPTIKDLIGFKAFAKILSHKYHPDNIENSQTSNMVQDSNSFVNEEEILKKEENKGYLVIPGKSFLFDSLFSSFIAISISLFILLFFLFGQSSLVITNYSSNLTLLFGDLIFFIIIILAIIMVLVFIKNYLLWKNTSYEFFDDKVLIKSGIINVEVKEIYYKNVKQITQKRNYFFDKIFNQGKILLFTPGTGGVEGTLHGIDNYKEIFEELKEIIINNK